MLIHFNEQQSKALIGLIKGWRQGFHMYETVGRVKLVRRDDGKTWKIYMNGTIEAL